MWSAVPDSCWMNLDTFYYSFALPVGAIVFFNLVTFIVIMFSLLRRPEGLAPPETKGTLPRPTSKLPSPALFCWVRDCDTRDAFAILGSLGKRLVLGLLSPSLVCW